MRMTNNAGLDLGIAVWLAVDEYQHDNRPNYISVTTLIKAPRKVVLGRRVPPDQRIPDILDRVNSSIGHVLHRGIEHSWLNHYRSSMEKLGYPKRVIDAVRVNPEKEEAGILPVYVEHRVEREFEGYIISGQIDLILEGRLRDNKSTKVWSYMNRANVDQWQLQGSIYRWLNPEKITHDEMAVQYLLLDWSRAGTARDPNYPATPVPTRSIELLGLEATEQWIRTRLALLNGLWDAPEADIPECSDDDLWRTSPVYKYYANPEATGRSTKNFEGPTAEQDARMYMSSKGGKGRIDYVPGEVKACLFCDAFLLCSQKDHYIADGSLKIPGKEIQ